LQALPELHHHPQLTQLVLANNNITSLLGKNITRSSNASNSSSSGRSHATGNRQHLSSTNNSSGRAGFSDGFGSTWTQQLADGWSSSYQSHNSQQKQEQQPQQAVSQCVWPVRLAVADLSGNQLMELHGLGPCPGLLTLRCERNCLSNIEVGQVALMMRCGTLVNEVHVITWQSCDEPVINQELLERVYGHLLQGNVCCTGPII
jgi:hypothetical protein